MATSLKTQAMKVRTLGRVSTTGFANAEKIIRSVSPLKPFAFSFRFNQIFGILPARISSDYMVYDLNAKWIVWTLLVKITFVVVIVGLSYGNISDQGFSFEDVLDRVTNNESFSRTDFFGIASHFMFLQLSAYVLFFNNLGLCEGLTHLCKLLKLDNMVGVDQNEVQQLAPPSAKEQMLYRYGVDVVCMVASVFLITGIHSIVRNPILTGYDYSLILMIVLSLYLDNQSHMFSELVFLRFNAVLDQRSKVLINHIDSFHRLGDRRCCVGRADNLHAMFVAINQVFSRDLLISVFILNINIIFGFYLLITFATFISCDLKFLFLIGYSLYAFVPCLRLYVISQSSERIRRKMKHILRLLHDVEAEMPADSPLLLQKKVRRTRIRFEGFDGFSAGGFFHLKRSLMTSIMGALITYLIVLLQFKQGDIQQKEISESAFSFLTRNLTNPKA